MLCGPSGLDVTGVHPHVDLQTRLSASHNDATGRRYVVVVAAGRDAHMPLAGEAPSGLPGADELSSLLDGTKKVVDLPTAPRALDGAFYKYVTVAFANTPRFVRLSLPIDDGSLLSPRYSPAPAGS